MTLKELLSSGASGFLTSEVLLEINVDGKLFRASLSEITTTDPISCRTCDTATRSVVLRGSGEVVEPAIPAAPADIPWLQP